MKSIIPQVRIRQESPPCTSVHMRESTNVCGHVNVCNAVLCACVCTPVYMCVQANGNASKSPSNGWVHSHKNSN